MSWNKSKDIFALMVGHGKMTNGKWDPGCAYGKYTEADLMLNITRVAAKWLRKSGVRVLTDADNKNNRNMTSSVAWANNRKCKYYMSVHCDYKLASKGVAPLYVSATGKKMAVSIGKFIAKKMDMKWKGAFKRKDLYELNATNMPAVILETGAIKADLKYLKDYNAYGKALAKAICRFIGVQFYISPRGKLINMAAETFAEMKKFKYTVSGNSTSWAGAKKKKTSNCATYMSYVLQRLGYLKAGQVFWCNDGVVRTKGSGTASALKKSFTISHPKKDPKKAGLKKGDICGYSKPAHTQMFAGYDTKGNALWYSFGPSDIGKKLPRKRGSYNTKKIDTIIRLK